MKKYKFLILEDDEIRMKEFYQRIKEVSNENLEIELFETDQASEAIQFLKDIKFDIIFLDHDLGGETYVDENNKNTGSEVARFIESSGIDFSKSSVIIHSMNDIAAESMFKKIKPNCNTTVKIQGIWFKRIWHEVLSIT